MHSTSLLLSNTAASMVAISYTAASMVAINYTSDSSAFPKIINNVDATLLFSKDQG